MIVSKTSRFIKICTFIIICCVLLSVVFVFSKTSTVDATTTTATYRAGANGASSSYMSGRYYRHYTQIPITGDGVTDTLAMALSQMGYQEGNSAGSYGGENSGSSNYTEFCYNMGDWGSGYGGSSYAWCATFVTWSLYQSRTSDMTTASNWCRQHVGDINYIWCEVSCRQWADQLKRFSYFKERSSGYTPKSGDLIFFRSFAHIGIVVWQDGTNVYTIEGNTSDAAGVEANGGGVYYKKYALSNTNIDGYGTLPYKTNNDAKKVDYSGANKTAGLYMANAGLNVSATPGGSTAKTISRFHMFNVKGFEGNYAVIEYDGNTYYGTLSSSTIQISASDSSTGSLTVSPSTNYNAGGADIPTECSSDPNVIVKGLKGTVNSYWGLEDYNINKSLVLVNGRTLSKWEEKSATAIERLWVRSKAEGEIYLGFDLNDYDALRLEGQIGNGEVLDTIVLKRGFKFANTSSNLWGQDNVFADSANVLDSVGQLEKNVVLKAKATGGFDVYIDGSMTNRTQSEHQYGVVVNLTAGDTLNVRSGPSASNSVLGTLNNNDKVIYYSSSGNWCNIDYNGTSGWVSASYFQVTGYDYTEETIELPMPGYEIISLQEVEATGSIWVVKTPAEAGTTNGIFVANAGDRFEYLGEMVDRWYKINYNGQVAYISSNYSTLLTDLHVSINALNPEWPHEHEYDNDCDITCNICSEERTAIHAPNADDNNCTTAITCSLCGAVTTEAKAEHNFGNDNVCDDCGYIDLNNNTNPDQSGDGTTPPDQNGDGTTNPDQSGDGTTPPDQNGENTTQSGKVGTGCASSLTTNFGGAIIAFVLLALALVFKKVKQDKKY